MIGYGVKFWVGVFWRNLQLNVWYEIWLHIDCFFHYFTMYHFDNPLKIVRYIHQTFNSFKSIVVLFDIFLYLSENKCTFSEMNVMLSPNSLPLFKIPFGNPNLFATFRTTVQNISLFRNLSTSVKLSGFFFTDWRQRSHNL